MAGKTIINTSQLITYSFNDCLFKYQRAGIQILKHAKPLVNRSDKLSNNSFGRHIGFPGIEMQKWYVGHPCFIVKFDRVVTYTYNQIRLFVYIFKIVA